MIPSNKPTAAEKQKDKVGKVAFSSVVKDLIGSSPTLEQTEKLITETVTESRKSIGKPIDFVSLSATTFRTKK